MRFVNGCLVHMPFSFIRAQLCASSKERALTIKPPPPPPPSLLFPTFYRRDETTIRDDAESIGITRKIVTLNFDYLNQWLRVSFCSFCDAHLWCQVSRTLLQYFQRYFLFSILPFFSCKSYDVITDLICIIQWGDGVGLV